MTPLLVAQSAVDLATTIEPMRVAARVLGLALLSAGVAGAAAVAYRWYARSRVPAGVAVLAGLSAVAVVLNTTAALGQVLGGADDPLAVSVVVFNVAAFLAAGVAASVGHRVGDRIAVDGFALVGGRELDADVSQLVQAVGRVVTVDLPEEIADLDGYDPAAESVKDQLAGKRLRFPRGLTVAELEERIATRLEHDYDVGRVDLELAVDGTVDYLAVGRRQAGLGPTLPPGSAAVAATADPPFTARAGDRVQLWARGDPPERAATAELRATAGDVVTLVADAADAPALAGGNYRLVTLPTAARPERDLAGLLRAADETLAVVTIREGSDLVGVPVGSIDATVVAVTPEGGRVEAIPPRGRQLAAGDTVFVVARPEAIRKVEAAAG